MRLSIVVPVLNSHGVVRRQLLHFKRMNLSEDVEIIYVDDGSNPPIADTVGVQSLRIHPTNDFRDWTWALARNAGARLAGGEYLLMTDLDYIIPEETIEEARQFTGDYMGFQRQFGVLDENGIFTQDPAVLMAYGLPPDRVRERGAKLPPHPNNFLIRKELFFAMGGYREDLIGNPYPQGEDNHWKSKRIQWTNEGRITIDPRRPMLYMFPNGRFCGGDVDYNPFGLFHRLSRKSEKNPWRQRNA